MGVIAFIGDQAVNDLLLYEIDPQELWNPEAL
jgi:hypothetical protein